LPGISIEGELRHDEDLPPDLGHRPIHLPLGVLEDPKLVGLPGQPLGLGRAVPLSDPDQRQEPAADLGHGLTAHSNHGPRHPLQQDAHPTDVTPAGAPIPSPDPANAEDLRADPVSLPIEPPARSRTMKRTGAAGRWRRPRPTSRRAHGRPRTARPVRPSTPDTPR